MTQHTGLKRVENGEVWIDARFNRTFAQEIGAKGVDSRELSAVELQPRVAQVLSFLFGYMTRQRGVYLEVQSRTEFRCRLLSKGNSSKTIQFATTTPDDGKQTLDKDSRLSGSCSSLDEEGGV
jgi:hypothetical protein